MKIALLGNPNTGKSTIFNLLTGLRQHIGNFPGVTVEKKIGEFISQNKQFEITDFPGTYSIYPRSIEEEVVYNVLSDSTHPDFPDLAIIILDSANLDRNLFLFTQMYDLNIPAIVVLNMSDIASRRGKKIHIELLEKEFPGVVFVETSARVKLGIDRLKKAIVDFIPQSYTKKFIPDFELFSLNDAGKQSIDTEKRYEKIKKILPTIVTEKEVTKDSNSNRLDKILVHPIFGYLLFTLVLFVLFQFIYVFASLPMDLIDGTFSSLSNWLHEKLPPGIFSNLISQGIVPGIGGVVIFVPQIALLFFFLSILEESGYLARVVFIMDRLMRPLGLNGKSVVPLLTSVACAIPGIMSTRTISNWKERLITIFVAPLMSCSARIPVYTLLISLVIPSKTIFGFIQLQGLVLFALYALGLISALLVAFIMKLFVKTSEKSFLLLEMPSYKTPRLSNIGLNVLEKVKLFIVGAGKVILAISIILWALASFGPSNKMEREVAKLNKEISFQRLSEVEQNHKIAAKKLENSYIGSFGKFIEPVIQPLGYDWKIGVSLLTSFAAREVFVGSLATIYAIEDTGEENTSLLNRLSAERNSDGSKVYTLATGVSLMVFYVYAMQCMATLAVVKRETKSWKWPIYQILFMGLLAYLGAYFTYQIFS